MVRTFSTSYNQTTNKVSAPEFPLILLELNHDDLASPLRVVNDRADVTHQSEVYQKFAFRFSFPTDPENGVSEAHLELDNVGRELMTWIESADWNNPTTVTITQIMRTAPDVAEYQFTMNLSNIKATQYTISGRLGYEEILGAPAIRLRYSPETAPGLF